MLIRDYGSFGMMGHDTGRDCPVPSGSFPSSAEIDAWCDCAYKDPGLNARCKVKYEMGKPIALIAAPWTTAPFCGAAARGLPLNNGGVLCEAVKWASDEVGKLIEKGVAGVTGGNVTGTSGNTQPTGGSAQPTGGNVQPTIGRTIIGADRFTNRRDYVSREIKGEIRRPGFDPYPFTPPGYTPPAVTSSSMGGMALVAALGIGAVLLSRARKPRSAPALSGYSSRRRRRR